MTNAQLLLRRMLTAQSLLTVLLTVLLTELLTELQLPWPAKPTVLQTRMLISNLPLRMLHLHLLL